MLMRRFYTLLFYLLLPFILLRLYWRGIKAPHYRQRWKERLGFYQQSPVSNVIWIHTVSVGEAEAAFPLINLLQTRHPKQRFLITTTTPTGSTRVQNVLGNSVEHVYLPYDIPWVIKRFFRYFQPKIAIFLEKEIWPNLYAACADAQKPIFIINARLSKRSARAYQKIPMLVKPALAVIKQIAAQSLDDKNRFIEIGAKFEQIEVQGNMKFDITVDQSIILAGHVLKNKLFPGRFVWIIASTHQGEEEIILKQYAGLKIRIPELVLLIVPRHPERFYTVKKLCMERKLVVVMRSEWGDSPLTEATDVYIADTMGELRMLYSAADVAFVAGSLAEIGGHNVLEPAAVGVPVLFGPHMFNFQEIAQGMLFEDAARQCQDDHAITAKLIELYENQDLRQRLTTNALRFVEKNQGAVMRIADMLEKFLY